MNMYEWMNAEDNAAPLHEDDSREDPSHRPQLPESDTPPVEDHVIPDPEMPTDISVSNESIIEDVRKLFKMHNRGKNFVELDGNASAGAAKIIKSIGDTFANKSWLDKQTPVDHKIKVSDLTDRLNFSNLQGTIKETYAINSSFQEALISAQREVVKQLAPALTKWNPTKLTDEMYESAKAIMKDLKSVGETIKKPTRTKTNLLPGESKDGADPLSVEDTQALASLILQSMQEDNKRIISSYNDLRDDMAGFFGVYNEVQREDAVSESYNGHAWEELCDGILRKMSIDNVPEAMSAFRQFEASCVAAVIYMERSFRGGKGEKVEEVSNEGIVDDIRKLFDANKDKDALKKANSGFLHDLEKELKNYTNPGWVKRRGIVEGDVSVSALNLLGQAGDKVVSDFVAKMKTARASKEKVLPGVIDGVEDIIKQLESGAGADASKAKAIIAKVNELRKYSIEELPWHKEKGRAGTIKALTELEVNTLAKQLADVFAAAAPVSGVSDEFRAVTKGEGTSWYRNWKFVEGKSHSKLYDQLKSAGVNPDSFFSPWEKLMESLSDDVQMGGELARIKPYLLVRFELIEKSVK